MHTTGIRLINIGTDWPPMDKTWGAQWLWEETADDGIPDSVEAFWETVRHQNYRSPLRDGDLCTVYQKKNVNGAMFEDVMVGTYDDGQDAVHTLVRISYDHLDVPAVTAEPHTTTYDRDALREDDYRIAAYETGRGLRPGWEKEQIDIREVPQHVMEQLKDHGTYYSKNGPDTLAMDKWDDRGIVFHEQIDEE